MQKQNQNESSAVLILSKTQANDSLLKNCIKALITDE